MKNIFSINWIVLIFGILSIINRILFFKIHDFKWETYLEYSFFILIIIALILLIIVVVKCFKRKFKPIIIYFSFVLIHYFVSIEFVTGYINFFLISSQRFNLVNNINTGKYDSLLLSDKYSINGHGTFLNNNPNHRFFLTSVYKDSTLALIKIPCGRYILSESFSFFLYISDRSKINDKRVYNFESAECNLTYLGNNWYWLYTYVTRTQAP
jgi:hypothetical protein